MPGSEQGRRFSPPIWVSLLLGFLAQLTFALKLSAIAGALLFALAAYVFVRSVRRSGADALDALGRSFDESFDLRLAGWKIEWLLVAALLAGAAFFRLHRIHTQPASLWLDESLTALNALDIIDGKSAPFWGVTPLDRWRPEWVKTSNLYLHYVAFVFRVFGANYMGLKMVSVLPAIAGVAAGYFLFKEMSNRAVAFVAAFLLAVSQWHVTISRWGWDAVLMSCLQLISYAFLLRGLGTGKKWQLIARGVCMGLCIYTYIASWIALAIALIFLLTEACLRPRAAPSRGPHRFCFLAACALTFAPLAIHYSQHPEDMSARLSEISLTNWIQAEGNYRPLWDNVVKYGLMFNFAGDSNARHGLPRAPALDFFTAIFFVFGLACCLRSWKRPQVVLALLWLGLGLQAGILADPSDAPNAYRTFMTSPIVGYFSALGIGLSAAVLWSAGSRAMGKAQVALFLPLGFIAAMNYSIYFLERPRLREVWSEEAWDAGLSERIASLGRQSKKIVVDPALLWKIVIANTGFLGYPRKAPRDSVFSSGSLFTLEEAVGASAGDASLVFIYSPVFRPMVSALFPDAQNEIARSPFGDPLYGVAVIPRPDVRSRLAAVDRERLTAAIQNAADYYRAQAHSNAESGPRRALLLREERKLAALKAELSRDRTH